MVNLWSGVDCGGAVGKVKREVLCVYVDFPFSCFDCIMFM